MWGSFFFLGLDEPWDHKQQCIRISLTATEEEIEQSVATIANVVEQVYEHSGHAVSCLISIEAV